MAKCVDCVAGTDEVACQDEAVARDPRTPPLEEGVCLCADHFGDAANEKLDALALEIDDLERQVLRVKRGESDE